MYKLSVDPCCFYSNVAPLICSGVASGTLTAVCREQSLVLRGLLLFSAKGELLAAPPCCVAQRSFKLGLNHKTGKQWTRQRHTRAQQMRTSPIDCGNALDWLERIWRAGIDAAGWCIRRIFCTARPSKHVPTRVLCSQTCCVQWRLKRRLTERTETCVMTSSPRLPARRRSHSWRTHTQKWTHVTVFISPAEFVNLSAKIKQSIDSSSDC